MPETRGELGGLEVRRGIPSVSVLSDIRSVEQHRTRRYIPRVASQRQLTAAHGAAGVPQGSSVLATAANPKSGQDE